MELTGKAWCDTLVCIVFAIETTAHLRCPIVTVCEDECDVRAADGSTNELALVVCLFR